jgi:hypothetical protein
MIKCEFCNSCFKTVSALNSHKIKAKYCLLIQNKIEPKNIVKDPFKCFNCNKILSSKRSLENHMRICNKEKEKIEFKCTYCNKVLSSKQILENHKNICTIKKNKDNELKQTYKDFEKEINEKETKIKEKEFEIKQKDFEIKQKDNIIIKINTKLENFEKRELELKQQIRELQDKLDKILNKAIDRPTTTNNTINNKFELNTFPSQKEIDRKIESQFNDKYILDGMKGIAQFVYDHIVKLEDGSMAYACYDTSRQIFKYKDENGNEIKDPKAVKLRKMIKPGLLRQSQTLLDYFNDECDYLEKRKDNGHEIDGKEYNMMNTLREKAFEVGCELLSIEETNKFSSELANLSCV